MQEGVVSSDVKKITLLNTKYSQDYIDILNENKNLIDSQDQLKK